MARVIQSTGSIRHGSLPAEAPDLHPESFCFVIQGVSVFLLIPLLPLQASLVAHQRATSPRRSCLSLSKEHPSPYPCRPFCSRQDAMAAMESTDEKTTHPIEPAVEEAPKQKPWRQAALPVFACGAGLFSDGYINNVRLHSLSPLCRSHRCTAQSSCVNRSRCCAIFTYSG